MTKFGDLAKQDRLARRETQHQYANRFGLKTATACCLWESGKRRVPDNVIEALVYDLLPEYQVCPTCNGSGMLREDALYKTSLPH